MAKNSRIIDELIGPVGDTAWYGLKKKKVLKLMLKAIMNSFKMIFRLASKSEFKAIPENYFYAE